MDPARPQGDMAAATVPIVEITGCRQAHARLLGALAGLTDEQARRPSLLPDWSVGHVLTHIARNADSVVRRLQGAAGGVVVDQYEGGYEGRAAEIEAGAGRPAAALLDDVRISAEAVDSSIAAMPAEAWDNPSRAVSGEELPARAVVFSRWREVEVHHVDLGLGYTPESWPQELVQRWLPEVLGKLPARAARAQAAESSGAGPVADAPVADADIDGAGTAALLAWALGRGPAPPLAPWG